jgi:hypothetical protein
MTDKIFTPDTVEQAPFPNEGAGASSSGSGVNVDTFSQASFPAHQVASEVISTTLNTQQARILASYRFSVLGAIQIGSYVAGVSGDIKISPAGIVGRNSAGTTTFTIDGTTGSATFLGTVTATAGLIGGFTLATGYMYAGSGANTAGMSPADYPFWAGATYANRATAPFRITPAGALYASNATITGAITATSGSFTGAITATSGTIGGTTISETSLTGGIIQTSASGQRIVMDTSNTVKFYHSDGGLVGYMYGGSGDPYRGVVILGDNDVILFPDGGNAYVAGDGQIATREWVDDHYVSK